TSVDNQFLAAEKPGLPLHIGGMAFFDGTPILNRRGHVRLEAVRALVAGHLHLVPRFRRKLLVAPFGTGLPYWVDAPQFDVAEHVRAVSLPKGGTAADAWDLATDVMREPLPRDRPLWEMVFIDRLPDNRVLLVDKIHHALVDGVSGAESLAVLLDPDPAAGIPEARSWTPAPPPAPAALLSGIAADMLRLPRSLGQAALDPRSSVEGARRRIGHLEALVRQSRFAPVTSLNQRVGTARRYLPLRQSLDVVKRIGHSHGTKVNDVVLAAVTSGLRALLEKRGELESVPELQVLVPVSLRADSQRLSLGNQVSSMLARLPVGEPDPVARLRRIVSHMDALKSSDEADGLAAILDTAALLPSALQDQISRTLVDHQNLVNLVVTNVPGPQMPLYLLGAEMQEVFPYVPLTGNLTVGIAILSYNGSLNLAVTADPDTCPDAEVLVEGMRIGFDELAAT
ncbi:MAG TPA: wax ester/triacylglycerol synthase family O-acyltransferase, partial [Acidimicrobiales bacterium]